MGYFDDVEGVVPFQMDMEPDYAQERGTTMDILHDLYLGTGQAIELLGRGVGSSTIQGAGESIQSSQFAKPDVSQYFGTQGRLGRVVDGIAQSAPLSVGLMATTGAGALVGGPVGAGAAFAGGMSVLGSGVFDQSYEEISKARPDLPDNEKFSYSMVNALSEVGTEAAGQLIPFGLGKVLSKGASKALVNSLVDSGRLTSQEAISSIVKSAGGKEIVKGLFGGATADGASEVVNELIQAANRDSAGLEENPVDLIDIFLIGSAPGGLIAGGTLASDINVKSRVRSRLEKGLQSEDLGTRQDTLNIISQGLNNIDPEIGSTFSKQMLPKITAGPVSLLEDIQVNKVEENVKEQILNKPEAILAEKGIPVKGDTALADAQAEDRVSLETPALPERMETVAQDAFIEAPSLNEDTRKVITGDVQTGRIPDVEIEAMKKELEKDSFYVNASRKIREGMSQVTDGNDLVIGKPTEAQRVHEEQNVFLVSNFAKAVAPNVGRISDDELVAMGHALRYETLDKTRASAIKSGMSKVIEDTNTLNNTEDLVARSNLKKEIQKTTELIKGELDVKQTEGVLPRDVPGSKDVATQEVSRTATEVTKEVVSKKTEVAPSKPTKEKASTLPVTEGKSVEVAKNEPTVQKGTGLYEGGIRVEEGNTAKGKMYKVIGKDGIVRRAGSQTEIDNAIKSGKVSELLPFEERKGRRKRSDKLNEGSLTEEQKNAGESFLESIGSFNALDTVEQSIKEGKKRLEGKLPAAERDVIEENLATLESNKSKLLDEEGKKWEAIALVQKEGKELNEKSFKNAIKYLEKQKENESEAQKASRSGQNVTSVGDIFDSAAVDIIEGEAGTEYIQKGKGESTLKKVTEVRQKDGTWKKVASSNVPKGAERRVTERTPDGKYAMVLSTERRSDGVSRISVDVLNEKGETIATGLSDRNAAQEVIKDERAKPVEKQKVVIRRRKDTIDEESGPLVDTSYSDGETLANLYLSNAKAFGVKNPLLHVRRRLMNSKDVNAPEALKVIDEKIKKMDEESTALLSKFPNAYALMDYLRETKLDKNSKALANFLWDTMDRTKLERFTIAHGPISSVKGNVITLRTNSTPEVILHEIVHALTVSELMSNRELSKKVTEMRDKAIAYAKKEGYLTPNQAKELLSLETSKEFKEIENREPGVWGKNRDIAYALLNDREFLAQAFSSKSFQSFLSEIKTDGSTKSLMKKFIELVKKVLNWVKEGTMLDDVILTVGELSATRASKYDEGMNEEASVFPVDTERAVAEIMRGRGPTTKYKELLGETGKNIKNFAEKLARPVSDNVRALSEKIYASLMKFESRLIMKEKEYSTKAKPFMKWYKALSDSQKVRYNLALMNSNTTENQKIIAEIPRDIMKGLNEVLDDLRKRSEEVGLSVGKKEFYFPRRVKDVQGLMNYMLRDSEYKGPIGSAFAEEAKRIGVVELTEDQRTQVITDMFQSGYFRQLPRPGASKQRTVPFVTADTYQFYSDANDSIMGHIFEMNEKVGQREFIGGSTRKRKIQELLSLYDKIEEMKEGDKKDLAIAEYDAKARVLEDLEAELQTGVSSLVYKEMGKQSAEDQDRMINLLNARLRQKGAHGVVDMLRNVGYITTMGNFLSAITQLGDIPLIFYANGLNVDSFKSIAQAFHNVYKVARADWSGNSGSTDALVDQVDFTNQLREFSQGSYTANWVEKAFSLSGLKYADLVGKEAFMQSSLKKWQRKENKDSFMKKYEPFFGEETGKVYSDIQLGKKTEDVMTVLIAELSDFQPVTLSQQSQQYLTGGNLRLFYMLKTFTMRATSAAIREGVTEMEKGNYMKGAIKFGGILMIYAAAGAGADELKDLIRGKESTIKDNTIDNLLQMFFLPKYAVEKGLKGDSLVSTLVNNLLPPFRYADNFVADVYGALSGDKELKFKSLQAIPLVGTIGYGRSAAGQSSYNSTERKAILEEVKKNKEKGRSPYSGGLSDRVREYNMREMDKTKWISADTVRNAYK